MSTSTMTWTAVSLAEALDHGRSRTIRESRNVYGDWAEGEEVVFTDGTVLQILRFDGKDWSESTWEPGQTVIRVGRPASE